MPQYWRASRERLSSLVTLSTYMSASVRYWKKMELPSTSRCTSHLRKPYPAGTSPKGRTSKFFVVKFFIYLKITLLLPVIKWLSNIVTIGSVSRHHCRYGVSVQRAAPGGVLSRRRPGATSSEPASQTASMFRLPAHFRGARTLIARPSYDRKSLRQHTSAPHYKPRRCAYRAESLTARRKWSAYIGRRCEWRSSKQPIITIAVQFIFGTFQCGHAVIHLRLTA